MITWNVNPNIADLGWLQLRWYGLSWALAILLGTLFFSNFIRREGLKNPKLLDSLFLYGVLATVLGARLGHCLFYEPWDYLTHPLRILAVWEGGLASHGAAVGLLVGLWLWSKKFKMPYLWSLDRIMVPVAIGGAAVRLGNLMNSEIYGRPTGGDWGFRFVRDSEWLQNSPLDLPVHPTQLYEAAAYIVVFGVLALLYYGFDMGRRRPGMMFGVGLVGVFMARFFIEYVKNPQEEFEQGMSLLMGQWLSVPFVALGIFMIVWSLWKKSKA